MNLDKIVALVPMRHASVRVPGKNYRPIAGKPLYHHILETLLACPEISQVVVDTDSPVILEGLARNFPSVTALLRPEHLRADTIPTNEILMHDTAQALPTSICRRTAPIRCCARRTVFRGYPRSSRCLPAYDSLLAVTSCRPPVG
jgi:CMP-N-acetylneuraminic acid synthetase